MTTATAKMTGPSAVITVTVIAATAIAATALPSRLPASGAPVDSDDDDHRDGILVRVGRASPSRGAATWRLGESGLSRAITHW